MAIPNLDDLEVIGSDLEVLSHPADALQKLHFIPSPIPPQPTWDEAADPDFLQRMERARISGSATTADPKVLAGIKRAQVAAGVDPAHAGRIPTEAEFNQWRLNVDPTTGQHILDPEALQRITQETEQMGLLTPLSDLSKAAVGDVGTAYRMLAQPSKAGEEAALSGGNVAAMLRGEDTMPIEQAMKLSSEEQKFRGETPIASGVGYGALGVAQTLPLIAGGATLPRAGQALLGTAFGAKMLAQDAPEIAKRLGEELGKPESQRDPEVLNKLYGDAGTVLLFTGLGAAGGPRMLEEIGQAGTKIPKIGPAFKPLANVRNMALTPTDAIKIFARDLNKQQLPQELGIRPTQRELGIRAPSPENVLGMTPELEQLAGQALTEASPTRVHVPGERSALETLRDRFTQPALPAQPLLTEARPGGGPALTGQIGAAARAEAQAIPSARQSVVDAVRSGVVSAEPSPLIQQVHEIVHSKDRTGLEEMRRELSGADVEDVELAKMRAAQPGTALNRRLIQLQNRADSIPELEMHVEYYRRLMERRESFGRQATETAAYKDYAAKMSDLQQRLRNAQEAKARLERQPAEQAPGVGVARGTSSDMIRLIDQRLKELETNTPHPENNAIRNVFKQAREAARPQAQRPAPTVETYSPGPYKQLLMRTPEGKPITPPGPQAEPRPGIGKNKGRWEIPGLGTFRDQATAADFAKRFNDAKISIYEAQAVYKRGGRMAVEMLMRERTGKTPKAVFPEGSKAEAAAKVADEVRAGNRPTETAYRKRVASTAKKLISEGYTDMLKWREELIKRHGLAVNEMDLQQLWNEVNPVIPEPIEPAAPPVVEPATPKAPKKPAAPTPPKPTAAEPPLTRRPAPSGPGELISAGSDLIEGGVKRYDEFAYKMQQLYGALEGDQLRKLFVDSLEMAKSRKARAGKLAGSRFERWADDTIKRMKGLGVRPVGTDEALAAYAIKGAAMLERGIRNFADWSVEMIKQFGEAIRPHLQTLWDRSNEYIKKGVPDAIKEREEQSSVQQQRERTDAQRVSAEAGAGDSLQREAAQRTQASQANVPQKIADSLGMRFDSEVMGRWMFTLFDDAGKESTTIVTKAGATAEEVRAKYESKRAEYGDQANAPRPIPEKAETPGETTMEKMSSMSTRESLRFFDRTRKAGNPPQADAVLAGLKLTEESIPELERLRDESGKAMQDAFLKGDEQRYKAEFGKNVWYSGVIEGIRREGPNYDAMVKGGRIPAEPTATEEAVPIRKDIEKAPEAECFNNARKLASQTEGSVVVHGKVLGASGKMIDHAWVEVGDRVIDPTAGVDTTRADYYDAVKAEPEAKYTPEQANINMVRSRNHGPWTDEEVGNRSVWRKTEPEVESVTPLEPSSGTPITEAAKTGGKLSATDALIERLESMRFEEGRGDRLYSLPHPDAIKQIGKTAWNNAIDVAIAAIKAGKKVGEAITAAITHLKRNVSNFDETQIRNNLRYILGQEAGGGGAAGATGTVARTRPRNAGLDDIYARFQPAPKPRVPVFTRVKHFTDWLRTAFSSKFRPLDRLAEDIAKAYGHATPTRIAHIFEQLKGASGKAEADVYRFDQDVTKLVGKDTQDFNAFMMLTRSLDRLRADLRDIQAAMAGAPIKKLNRRAVSDYIIPELEAKLQTLKTKLGPDKLRTFERAADLYQQHMDVALRLQVESGRMSQELYDHIKSQNDFYAPFKLLEYYDQTSRAPGTGKQIDTVTDYTKAMEGIQNPDFKLGDMLAAARQNIVLSRTLAEKNLKMQQFADMADADTRGLFVRKLGRDQDAPPGMQAVNVKRNGVTERYAVNKDVGRAVKMWDTRGNETLSKFLRYAAVPFRLGATTANIAFQFVNLALADAPTASQVAKTGMGGNIRGGILKAPGSFLKNFAIDSVRYPLDFLHSLFSAMEGNMFHKEHPIMTAPFRAGRGIIDLMQGRRPTIGNKMFLDYLDSGAAGAVIQDYITPKLLQYRPPAGTGFARRFAMSVLRSPADFAKAIEETHKILGVRRAMRITGAETGAELGARFPEWVTEVRRFSGSPDFGRIGAYTDAARLNFLLVFFNARVQGAVANVGRVFLGRDGADAAATAWVRLGLTVGIPTAALYYFNHLPENKADYEARPKNERDNYFLIPKNKYITDDQGNKVRDYWRIPKREIVQIFANTIESGLKFSHDRHPEAFWSLAQDTMENIAPVNIRGETFQERVESVASSLNPAIKAPLELGTGRNLFRHQDIIPDPQKKVNHPELQYLERTPMFYRKWAALMPDVAPKALRSPLMLENITQNLTAGLIQQFLPSHNIPGRTGIENFPLLRRFQSAPYAEDPEEMKTIKKLQGDAAEAFLLKDRAATEAIINKPTIQEVAQFVVQKYGTNQNAEAIFARSVDLWLAQKNGITRPERQVMALPSEQRAAYILQKLHGMTPDQKVELLHDYQRKRILTESVIEEMIKQLPFEVNGQ